MATLNPQLQPATESHAAAIRQLVTFSGINPTGLDWRRFVIALDDAGELVGCGQIKPHRDGTRELASIAVTPPHRHQGIATALIQRLIEGEEGDLYLMCQSSLGPLYERFGFQSIGEDQMPKYFRRISQLAGVLESVRRQGETLLIMLRPAQ